MIRILQSNEMGRVLARRAARMADAEATVRPILEAVRKRGDKGLMEYARKLKDTLEAAGLRVGMDTTAESVGKKIRAAGLAKVPYTLVVGEKERESGKVSPRLRQGHGEFDGELGVDDFVGALSKEVAGRAQASGL